MGNDVYICEMAQVFEKQLNYMGNDLDGWEMGQTEGWGGGGEEMT